jgi:hypothetical protein
MAPMTETGMAIIYLMSFAIWRNDG